MVPRPFLLLVSFPDPHNPSEDRLRYPRDTASDLRWGCLGLVTSLLKGLDRRLLPAIWTKPALSSVSVGSKM